MTRTGSEHWDAVYAGRPSDGVSWYQARPDVSLRLARVACPGRGSLVDVGAGASLLADALLDDGWGDVTVLDLSATALAEVRGRLAGRAGVALVVADVLEWQPDRRYDVWHDRAVLHFLTADADRARYAATAGLAVAPGGAAVIGAFALDGPTSCSGLPTVRYDAAGLAAVLGPGWALEHAVRERHVTPTGAVQPFTWAVLRRTGEAGHVELELVTTAGRGRVMPGSAPLESDTSGETRQPSATPRAHDPAATTDQGRSWPIRSEP